MPITPRTTYPNVVLLLLALACLGTARIAGAACPVTLVKPRTFYVDLNGNDANPGTVTAPFQKIQTAIDCATVPGDRVFIRGGTYAEPVTVIDKHGSLEAPIVIEGQPGFAPGPVVTILATLIKHPQNGHPLRFHEGTPDLPNGQWEHAIGPGARPDEYVSKESFPKPAGVQSWAVNRGSFVGYVEGRYTQLIPYGTLQDLRAYNETDERICDRPGSTPDPRKGFTLALPGVCDCVGCTARRPWFYMGPGLFFDAEGRIHVRLAPTHNAVLGLADYAGQTDPNKVRLTIAEVAMNAGDSSNITFKRLAFQHGGQTIRTDGGTNLVFQEVIVRAGQYGANTQKVSDKPTTGLRFVDCLFDGGLPTWMFRSDIKNEYKYTLAGQVLDNPLGKQTMKSLFAGKSTDEGTTFESCEFVNAHDLYLAGNKVAFHHNLIRNLHDDALFLDPETIASGVVHHNVIEQVLTGFSSASAKIVASPWRIYRNLVDLRKPTAGFRPFNPNFLRARALRPGRTFKKKGYEGTYDVFQNTVVAAYQLDRTTDPPTPPQTIFDQWRSFLAPGHSHRELNNIFVMQNREGNVDPAIVYLPPRDFPASDVRVDGNLYYRQHRWGELVPPADRCEHAGVHVLPLSDAGDLRGGLAWPARRSPPSRPSVLRRYRGFPPPGRRGPGSPPPRSRLRVCELGGRAPRRR